MTIFQFKDGTFSNKYCAPVCIHSLTLIHGYVVAKFMVNEKRKKKWYQIF